MKNMALDAKSAKINGGFEKSQGVHQTSK